ncbi:MAG: hypothetical protein V7698_18605 [Paracoccaceae bacterium]
MQARTLRGARTDLEEIRFLFDLNFMRTEIVLPSIARFFNEPNSISLAAAAIWAVDAYASHAAFAMQDEPCSEKDRSKIETHFKNSLQKSASSSAWRFHVLRETSNALKHGIRREGSLVSNSGLVLRDRDIISHAWHFSNAGFWGLQVVVELNLTFISNEEGWAYDGMPFGQKNSPFFSRVAVFDILQPSLDLIDEALHQS